MYNCFPGVYKEGITFKDELVEEQASIEQA
jgi:hypothetical protein